MVAPLEDHVILVTGAAMGLGFAAAQMSAAKGARVALIDYDAEALAEAERTLGDTFGEDVFLSVEADVAEEAQVEQYVKETVDSFGRIDGFYNNAGIEGRQALLHEYDRDTFERVLGINLMGAYYGLRYVLPVMKEQAYGHVVNVASVAGLRGVMNQTPYTASKHGVVGMTKNAAIEYAQDGINVNAIAPGAILTPMVRASFEQVNPDDPELAHQEFAAGNPTGRLGEAEEVAELVTFLLSDAAAYVNGQTIAIDGGQSIKYG